MLRVLPTVALALATVLGMTACSDQPDKPRRQQTLKLLPDTPPPPPPPPPPKPPEVRPPKPEDKPQPQDAPKPVQAPEPQQLKTDEAAGNGPGSGLASGNVTEDYKEGAIGKGSSIGGSAPADGLSSRLAANAFGTAATRALNDFLTRDREVKLHDYRVRVAVWFTTSGSVQRAELIDSTGNTEADTALRAALQRFPGTTTAPPANLPQPLRVMVSNRLLG